jgi:hypothetical protein
MNSTTPNCISSRSLGRTDPLFPWWGDFALKLSGGGNYVGKKEVVESSRIEEGRDEDESLED